MAKYHPVSADELGVALTRIAGAVRPLLLKGAVTAMNSATALPSLRRGEVGG
jgi:hypothetical protein